MDAIDATNATNAMDAMNAIDAIDANLAGKRVVAVGLARSGVAACRLLLKQGATVIGTDRRGKREIGADLCSLEQDGVSLELGEQYLHSLLSADLVVVSPGIDLREPLFQRVREVGIPLIGEVELAYRYSEATFIGITGTNGKSTTTTLLGAILRHAGLPSHVAGNIGTPLCRVAPSLAAGECVVVELSSFQLETIEEFRPRVALLLNLAPDHLDRYDQVEDYYQAKARIFENQRPSDFAVINADDPLVLQVSARARGRRIAFSRTRPLDTGAYVWEDHLVLNLDGRREAICRVSELRIQGVHNLENALAASLAAGECVVVELSSFQLETIEEFRPRVALLLNLAPDHLDRYACVEQYYQAKARIFENQRPSDFAIVNADDPLVIQAAAQAQGRRIAFSRTRPLDTGAYVEGDQLMLALDGMREVMCRISELKIQGVHNLENALAAGLAAAVAGAPTTAIRLALTSFEGLEHRLEFVAEIDGVRYVNDSKGTNVGAVVRSLESFTNPVVLIAGGRDKHGDFAPLIPLVRERVKRLILIGEAAPKLRLELTGACPMEEASSLEEAVRRAAAAASPGEVVLLSPACASFDMFTDFEERGRVFKVAVRELLPPAYSIPGQA